MIINLKPIKRFIKYLKFKMDTFKSCLNLVHEGDFCVSVDLSDAYYTLPMNAHYKKYVRFIWRGVRYQFNVLAMGLSPAPRQFTKLMKPVLAHLQKQGVTVQGSNLSFLRFCPADRKADTPFCPAEKFSVRKFCPAASLVK